MSVYGTVTKCAPYEDFLVSVESASFALAGSPSPLRVFVSGFCLAHPLEGLDPVFHHGTVPILLRPHFGQTHIRWYWNINQFSIGYALRPRLRSDLPWADFPSPGNLRFTACRFFIGICATYAGIISSAPSILIHIRTSQVRRMLPYHCQIVSKAHNLTPRSFGVKL